jgi:hypothetical protein
MRARGALVANATDHSQRVAIVNEALEHYVIGPPGHSCLQFP